MVGNHTLEADQTCKDDAHRIRECTILGDTV